MARIFRSRAMIIHKIALNGFRNYEWETADFSSRTNVITGENAQGKTNLLEAVYLLSSGKSFRTRFDRELIGFDFSEAEILAEVFSHDTTPGGMPPGLASFPFARRYLGNHYLFSLPAGT